MGGLGEGWEGLKIWSFPQLGVGVLACPISNGSRLCSVHSECTISRKFLSGFIKLSWWAMEMMVAYVVEI